MAKSKTSLVTQSIERPPPPAGVFFDVFRERNWVLRTPAFQRLLLIGSGRLDVIVKGVRRDYDIGPGAAVASVHAVPSHRPVDAVSANLGRRPSKTVGNAKPNAPRACRGVWLCTVEQSGLGRRVLNLPRLEFARPANPLALH